MKSLCKFRSYNLLPFALVSFLLVSCAKGQTNDLPSVPAIIETEPVRGSGDSGDDMAIWLHPTDVSQSTIIGTDSKNGFMVYDLAGNELYFHEIGGTGMVDLRYDFSLDEEQVALLAAGNLASNSIKLYRVDPSSRDLVEVSARAIQPNLTIYGTCMYHSKETGDYYVFVTSQKGEVEQWRLFGNGDGQVDAELARSFTLNPDGPDGDYTIEGCVADDVSGRLYMAQEGAGRIWRIDAEPVNGQLNQYMVDQPRTEGGHTVADVEGLAIYHQSDSTGYLVANNQGSYFFTVYTLEGSNDYLTTFAISESDSVDAVTSDDSIELTSLDLGPQFPKGLLVVEDGENSTPGNSGHDNYKLISWEQVINATSLP
jgi:3-phytase